MYPSMLYKLHNDLADTAHPELSSDKVAPVAVYNNADTQSPPLLPLSLSLSKERRERGKREEGPGINFKRKQRKIRSLSLNQ